MVNIQTVKNKRKSINKSDYNNLAGYAFISPWLIGFIIFTVFPMLMALYFSFTKYDVLSTPEWIGLENYKTMFTSDDRFRLALGVTFKYVFTAIPLRLIFALFVAMLFVKNRKLVPLYRTVYYLPSIIGGSVAVAVMWRQLFGVNGALNGVLSSLGLLDKQISWIGNPNTALWTLVLLAVWQFGSPMLIFLAGLKQIPSSYYESASIDGANGIQQFTKITLPMLTPIIFFNLVMQIISGFMAFTESYIITQGGPFDRTLFYALYLFQQGFQFYNMGYACALAWVLLLIMGAFTAIIFKSSNYWVYSESKGE
jgi:multiple sugar transport system permease protein